MAAPALIGFVSWVFAEARRRGISRLRFLSRDRQVLYELAWSLATELGPELDLQYVYSSRMTWSLAATDPNSFIKSNAADLCTRLRLQAADFGPQPTGRYTAHVPAGTYLVKGQSTNWRGANRCTTLQPLRAHDGGRIYADVDCHFFGIAPG